MVNSLILNLRLVSLNRMLLRMGIWMMDRLRISLRHFRSNLCLWVDLIFSRLHLILMDVFIHMDQ